MPRQVDAGFYEFLREALPVFDAAIGRLVSLDGHIEVVGNNDALVDEITDWMDNVPVNDIQTGFQAFHQGLTSEAHEQGFVILEFVPDRKRTDIVNLRVADSKTIKFQRTKTGLDIYQQVTGDTKPRLLKPDTLMYFGIGNEDQNPYGTSLFRSCEFVGKILATIHNALLNVWERFGDPAYKVVYTASRPPSDGSTLEDRRQQMSENFNTAVRAKREGKSADFVLAIDKESGVDIGVLGSDGQVMEVEMPSRHILEQFVAKSGLPPWMYGFHWSTTERLSDAQAGMLLADVRTRQAAKLPLFTRLVSTMLLLRGRSWKKGDWKLQWAQVNLLDAEKQARARFLNAQADMMTSEAGAGEDEEGKTLRLRTGKTCGCHGDCHGHKELTRAQPWPEMDRLEAEYESDLKANWSALEQQVMEILGLANATSTAANSGGGAKQPPVAGLPTAEAFTFSEEQRARVFDALRDFIGVYDIGDEDSAVRWYYGQAYSAGLIQAARMVGQERPILDAIRNRQVLEKLYREGFKLVKDRATKRITAKILPELDAQVIAGSNPRHVGARLRKLFGDANSDWERLARTELSMAGESAKVDEWGAQGVDVKGAVIAGRDTHPRCRCGNVIEYVNDKPVVKFLPAPDACPICLAAAR